MVAFSDAPGGRCWGRHRDVRDVAGLVVGARFASELGERLLDVPVRRVDTESVMTTSKVLHERVTTQFPNGVRSAVGRCSPVGSVTARGWGGRPASWLLGSGCCVTNGPCLASDCSVGSRTWATTSLDGSRSPDVGTSGLRRPVRVDGPSTIPRLHPIRRRSRQSPGDSSTPPTATRSTGNMPLAREATTSGTSSLTTTPRAPSRTWGKAKHRSRRPSPPSTSKPSTRCDPVRCRMARGSGTQRVDRRAGPPRRRDRAVARPLPLGPDIGRIPIGSEGLPSRHRGVCAPMTSGSRRGALRRREKVLEDHERGLHRCRQWVCRAVRCDPDEIVRSDDQQSVRPVRDAHRRWHRFPPGAGGTGPGRQVDSPPPDPVPSRTWMRVRNARHPGDVELHEQAARLRHRRRSGDVWPAAPNLRGPRTTPPRMSARLRDVLRPLEVVEVARPGQHPVRAHPNRRLRNRDRADDATGCVPHPNGDGHGVALLQGIGWVASAASVDDPKEQCARRYPRPDLRKHRIRTRTSPRDRSAVALCASTRTQSQSGSLRSAVRPDLSRRSGESLHTLRLPSPPSRLATARPFCAPHHTATTPALVGGGSGRPVPGRSRARTAVFADVPRAFPLSTHG
jgi:hypothetical protein